MVMDSLPAHKGERIRELIEGVGSVSLCTCRPTRRTLTR
jgi:hypothetical protein